ncbi:MAG: hypothetical protein AAF737_05795 [Pseudomonadota bacterium]
MSRVLGAPRVKRLVVRGGERRCGQKAYKGRDRRRANYDRRKLSEPQSVKPPMSDAPFWSPHMPGYVAGVAAEMSGQRRATGAEAHQSYGAALRHRNARLLRGLTVDAEID